MIQDIDEINVTLGNDNSIDISIDNDNSISVTEGTPTDISEIMHNEEIRQENEAQRIANEEDREDYINDLKQRVEAGEFNGEDGYSPTATVSKTDSTATITITDKNGTTTAQISDGTDGRDGVDGQDGTDGVDGYSPTVTMTKQGKVTTLTITDKNGEHTTEIKDGQDGSGTGDMLKATYDTNDNGIVDNAEKVNNHTVLTDVPANAVFTDTTYTAGTGIDITNNVISNTQTSAEWGSITGTLSDQTDLNSALSGKQDLIDSTHKLSADLVDDTSTTNKFFSGNYNDLTNKPTIPTNTSDLTNDSNFISTSSTAGLIKNDGTIDTTSYSTFSGSYTDLSNKPTIPDELADLSDDSTHRVVTDTEKTTWNGKQNAITSSNKLSADLINDSSTTNKFVTLTEMAFWNDKQESLVSGTNIKTINNTSILGSGNLDVGADIPQQDSAPSNPQEDDLWIDTDEPGIVTSNKMMLVIGDSFSNNAQSGTPLWYTYVSRWHDLTVYTTASDGMGYATGNNSFLTQLQTANNDSTLTNDDVKEIYIVGGLNDLGNESLTAANFETAVINTLEYAEEHFGNALIYVVGIFPFQWYNFYSGNACFTDNLRAKTFQAKLSNACITSDTNRVIFKNSQYFGLSTYGYFGEANAYNQRHPSALGEKMIAQFIQTGENKFGIPDANWDECYLKETPLVVSNASNTHAWINFIDDNSISINVENYDNTKTLYLYMTGLPDSNTYLSVTDEQGHFAFMWKDYNDNKYQMPSGVGLNSGNIYLNMNTGFRD